MVQGRAPRGKPTAADDEGEEEELLAESDGSEDTTEDEADAEPLPGSTSSKQPSRTGGRPPLPPPARSSGQAAAMLQGLQLDAGHNSRQDAGQRGTSGHQGASGDGEGMEWEDEGGDAGPSRGGVQPRGKRQRVGGADEGLQAGLRPTRSLGSFACSTKAPGRAAESRSREESRSGEKAR